MKYRNENQGPDMLIGSKLSLDVSKISKLEHHLDTDLNQSHQRDRSKQILTQPTSFGSQGICSERSSYIDPVILSNEQTLSRYNR